MGGRLARFLLETMMDIHEMDGYEEGNITIWNCPICGRKILVSQADAIVMNDGDPAASHRGGLAALAEQTPDPFERWADSVDVDALFDSPCE